MLAALVGRHVREAVRAPGFAVRVLLGLVVLALATLATSGGMGGAARGLAGGAALFAFAAAAQAASAAAVLPADRREGRRLWLGTLTPPAVAHRVAAAAAGVVRIAGAALAASVVLTLALGAGPGLPRLDRESKSAPRAPELLRAVRGDQASPAEVTFDAQPVARRLALDLRPVLLSFDASPRAIDIDVRAGTTGEPQRRKVPVRGVVVFDVPPGTDSMQVVSRSSDIHLRVVSARLLSPSDLPSVLVALLVALSIALAVASVVPWAVSAARFTSAPTAAGLTGCLLLVGAVGRPLLSLVTDIRTADWARGVLEGVTSLAPDFGLVDGGRALLEGRVPDALLSHAGSSLLVLALGFVVLLLPGGESRSET